MKKTILFWIIFFLMFPLNSYSEISASAGYWLMTWEQSDKPDTEVVKSTIYHTFKIDNLMAREISLAGKWKFIKLSLKYLSTDEETVKNTTKAEKLFGKLGIDFNEFSSTITYIKGTTNGIAEGYDTQTQNRSYIDFSTSIYIYSIEFSSEKLLNNNIKIGFQNIKYQLPQTFYILNNNQIILQAVESAMEWDASFLTVGFSNINSNNLFFLSISAGYGLNVNVSGKYSIDPSGYGVYLKGKTAFFYKGEAGINYKVTKHIYLNSGYRYTKYTFETEKDTSSLNIYAKATSTLFGPYLKLKILF
ncbi:hypothetical protein [Desulfurobacterium atlanticum]|uniref:Uncharacterized protein n=1 Tax=Desulfurobacterium atlanticum TaxID=240169 RepID=A0A238YWK4_9BACT|nr:hypothetical protein [Desulfurobacterium atlanticum]SNR75515.1 hypothetical protein SAMN06265340_10566 [Desulfurobacterium atlanticum]